MARQDVFQAITALSLLAGLALPTVSLASSWSNQPSWAATESSSAPSTSRRNRERERYSNYEVSPFSPGSHNVSLDVGQTFLMGDLSDKYDSSIGTQIHYTYGVSDLFGFDGSVS